MSETISGAYAYNDEAKFNETSDPNFYEADGESQQLYLNSVLPTNYDPTLEPYNTRSINPKKYIEQDEFGFHKLPHSTEQFQYIFNNTDSYFQPENKDLIHFTQ